MCSRDLQIPMCIRMTLARVYSAWFAFLLPSYGTWKALTHRPLAEPDLERWCMYWSVVGAFVAVEYVTGFILDW